MERDDQSGRYKIQFKKRPKSEPVKPVEPPPPPPRPVVKFLSKSQPAQPPKPAPPAPPAPPKLEPEQAKGPTGLAGVWELYYSLPPSPPRTKLLRKILDFFSKKTGDSLQEKRADTARKDAMIDDIWKAFSLMPLESDERRLTRDALFLHFWDDCDRSVKSFHRRKVPTRSLVEVEDVAQMVSLRLIQAINKFDHTRGMKFMQYFNAKGFSQLQGGMIDSLRDLQEFPRETAKQKRKIRDRWNLLRQIIGREPKPEDYCDVFGWDKKEELLADSLLFSSVFNQQQGSSEGGDDDDSGDDYRFSEASLKKMEATPGRQEEALLNEQKLLDLISKDVNNPMRQAFWCYYWCDMTSNQTAELQGCSTSTAYDRLCAGEKIILESFTRKSFLKWIGREVDR